jgi:hypothetical protein
LIYIYALCDPESMAVRYVGKTNDIKIRLKYHIGHCRTNRTHCARWIMSLMERQLRPVMIVLESVDDDKAEERERYWIRQGRECGWNLTNHTDGGEGTKGYRWSDDQRKGFGIKKKGIEFTEAHRENLSVAQKERLKTGEHVRLGMKHSPEAIEKMRESHTGKKRGEETKRKHSERNRETWNNPEVRRKRTEGVRLSWRKRKQGG